MLDHDVRILKFVCGASNQAIIKYVKKHFNVFKDEKVDKSLLKPDLTAVVKKRGLKQSKGECFVSICGVTTEAGGNGM